MHCMGPSAPHSKPLPALTLPWQEEGSEGGEEEEGAEEEGEGEGEEEAAAEAEPERPPPRRKLQPFEVPTSGAFWLHDDRFDDSGVTEEDMRQRWAGWGLLCGCVCVGGWVGEMERTCGRGGLWVGGVWVCGGMGGVVGGV